MKTKPINKFEKKTALLTEKLKNGLRLDSTHKMVKKLENEKAEDLLFKKPRNGLKQVLMVMTIAK